MKRGPLPNSSEFDPATTGTFNLRLALPSILFDAVLPIAAFNILTSLGVSTLWALVAGGGFPAAHVTYGWMKSSRLDALGMIVLGFLILGTGASLISGSVFFALIKDSFLTALFGLVCLGSLLGARPLMFYIIRQFVAGDDPTRIEWWNGLWEYPSFSSALRFITAMWGIVYIAEALVRVGFALIFPPAIVVTISPIMAFGVTIVMTVWTRRSMLALRERRLREMQLSQAS